ncbi:MAG: sulfatase-like hydrolase/transferase [Lachnospiraceae bacterium]|nr:sulfatase-like hydrolase/transferase [Lachnospiraceae bacterium]
MSVKKKKKRSRSYRAAEAKRNKALRAANAEQDFRASSMDESVATAPEGDHTYKADTTDKAGIANKVEKNEKADRKVNADKSDKTDKTDKTEKSDKAETSVTDERKDAEPAGHSEKPGAHIKGTVFLALFFSISFFFTETVFKLAVESIHAPLSFAVMGLFALSAGFLTASIISLFPRKVTAVLSPVILTVLFFAFLIEFLICREFKVAYDINTIFNAATDALGGFKSDIAALIFCTDGIMHILLFAIPLVLWFILGRKITRILSGRGIFGKGGLKAACGSGIAFTGAAAAYAGALVMILGYGIFSSAYTDQYNFEAAVSDFGLGTAVRLDVKNIVASRTTGPEFETGYDTFTASVADPTGMGAGSLYSGGFSAGVTGQTSVSRAATSSSNGANFNSKTGGAGDGQVSGISRVGDPASAIAADGYVPKTAGDDVDVTAGVGSLNEFGISYYGSDSVSGNAVSGDMGSLLPVYGAGASMDPASYGYSISDIDFNALAAAGGKVGEVDAYVASLQPSRQNPYTGMFKGKNLIIICAEAFSGPNVIDPDLTPTLYRLSTKGINFNDYYQQSTAGTTGGEYQLLFGLLPTSGGSSVRTITANGTHTNIGAMLGEEGYYGMAFHNGSYTYYHRNETHNKLGYSEGFMGMGNGMEAFVGKKWPESDVEMMEGTLPMYIDHQPFSVYYMSVSGHSGYTFGTNAMSKKNRDAVEAWCEAKGLQYSEEVMAYLAANLELENAVAYIVETLEEKGIADDTVICINADHFPYGLDKDASLGNMPYLSELYGYPVTTYEERDRNRAIIWSGMLEKYAPIEVNTPASSIDLLPTLCNLFDTDWDSRLYPGRDVFSDALPVAFNTNYDWKTDLGTYNAAKKTFTPVNDQVVIPDGYVAGVSSLVKNKITFCKSVLNYDYYTHVYAETP